MNMAVYVILDIEVIDWDLFPEYRDKVGPVVEKFGGRFLTKGGEVTPLFGDWDVNRIIIAEFPSKAQMKICVESDEYLALKAIRDKSANTRGILVDGVG
jgi:uncharacterized protein (DUF1330 family)